MSVSGGQMHITGANNWNTYAYRTAGSVEDSQAVRFTFKVNSTTARSNYYLDAGVYGQSSYRRWMLSTDGGYLTRTWQKGTTTSSPVTLMAVKANTWYEAVLGVDAYGQFRVAVWERDNPAVLAQKTDSFSPVSDWAGLSWRYVAQVYSGVVDIDSYREYDDGGIGQRTSMTDASGSAVWRYDPQGRPVYEKKVIGTTESFITRRGYNAAELPSWMIYPGGNNNQAGEQVNYAYKPQMLLNSLSGSATYVQSTAYDAAGRMTQIVRGAGTLTSNYTYYGWTETATVVVDENPIFQGARLKQMTTGTLQNLTYAYRPGRQRPHHPGWQQQQPEAVLQL